MRVMNIFEFADWVRHSGTADYIFSTENNSQHELCGISASFHFHEAVVSIHTGRVLFRSRENILCIGRIKEVRIYELEENVGIVLEFVSARPPSMVYRFLAE